MALRREIIGDTENKTRYEENKIDFSSFYNGEKKNGKKHGEFIQYCEEGKIKQRAFWKDGVEVGGVEVFENEKVKVIS